MSYVRVSILGQMTNGEVWSINPTFDPSGEFGTGVDQAQIDAAATAIAALSPPSSLLTLMSNLLQITGARVEVRDDSSDALLGISTQARTTALSGSVGPVCPPQSALVFSLRTNTPGGSGRGRLYWPALGVSLGSNGRIAAATVTTNLTSMKTYLLAQRDALATAFPTIGFNLAVRSRQTKTTPHVVRLQAGDVVDTQRRRRDNLAEAYVSTTIP